MFNVAPYTTTLGVSAVMLQDHGGRLQPVPFWARKLNPSSRGNTYSSYDLEALAVCEVVKHWRCYLEGCSKFLVITCHDKLRHLLKQPNNMLNKRQARYLRDLQTLVGMMTLAYRKGALSALNEAYPFKLAFQLKKGTRLASHVPKLSLLPVFQLRYTAREPCTGPKGTWLGPKGTRLEAQAVFFSST
jgi:hypothetical protein